MPIYVGPISPVQTLKMQKWNILILRVQKLKKSGDFILQRIVKIIETYIGLIKTKQESPIHNHEPEQYYCVIRGNVLMIIDYEQEYVNSGDTIYIPSN